MGGTEVVEGIAPDLAGSEERMDPSELGECLDLPVMELEGSLKQKYLATVTHDESLVATRKMADEKKVGFLWQKGILLKRVNDEWGKKIDLIVVPSDLRKEVLSLAHKRCGHLGAGKVSQNIGKLLYWPGMGKEVKAHCKACQKCQAFAKTTPPKAPLVETRVLTEPFEKIAVDI